MMKKDKYTRAFIYKVYKILCKALKAEAICFGKTTKKSKEEVIYTVNRLGCRFPVLWKTEDKNVALTIHGNAKRDDIQKAIVLRVMKALETGDIWTMDEIDNGFPIVKKGTCFEEKVIEMDLGWSNEK